MSSDKNRCCFEQWMSTQQSDLSELLLAQQTTTLTHDNLNQLLQKNIQHFQDYTDARTALSHTDPFPYFSPSWCTSLEGSLLWLGGSRPSLLFRHLYALTSVGIEGKLSEFLQGITNGNLVGGDLCADQLCRVNALHCKTMKEEVEMTSKWAGLQEGMANEPLAVVAGSNKLTMNIIVAGCEAGKEVDEHERVMASIMEEADTLRMRTLKEVLTILTPLQGVVFLAEVKKFNVCIHEWGKKRDHLHGRNQTLPS